MKTFLALLISCLTLTAATTYPVLTDSTNRLFPGGLTNVFILNSNVVTTGTMRATGALTLTNASNIFAGDGSGLTGISAGISKTNGSATNLSVYSAGSASGPLQIVGTNGYRRVWLDDDAALYIQNNTTNSYTAGVRLILGEDSFSNPILQASKVQGGANSGFFAGQYFSAGSSDSVSNGLTFFYNGNGPYLTVGNTVRIGWNSSFSGSCSAMNSADVSISRISSATLGIYTSQTSASLADMALRSVFATNLYATNLIVNGGATVTKILSATASLNFDLTALTVEDLTITVTGAADGDVVTLGVPSGSVTTSVQYTAWVSAADTVTVRARTSATGENPASGTFRATVIKH